MSAPASLHLGVRRDDDAPVTLPPNALLRHVVALGSSGSGKTVLAKVLVEEVLRRGIPAICVDPQGDLASLVLTGDPAVLAERGVDPALVATLRERVDPVIFTPASTKGIGIGADPVERELEGLDASERMQVFSRTAAMVVSLLGYELDADDGAGLTAALDAVLSELAAAGRPATSLLELSAYLGDLEAKGFPGLQRLIDPKRLRTACQRLARLDVGIRRLLFHEGVPLDIDLLAGRSPLAAPPPGKTRLSILYLNTLHSPEDKDFLVAALTSRLYGWMLRHPSSEPQLLYYVDEVAPYVPPVRKPAAKEPLVLLFKQARKYGVCCLMATQNPGDLDYKAMAQFGTWGLGRLTTRQDLKKLAPAIKSLAPTASDAVLATLPSLRPGEFVLLSPDHFPEPCPLATRWLATRHETLDEDRVSELTPDTLRARFAPLALSPAAGPSPAAAPAPTTAPTPLHSPSPPDAPAAPPGKRPVTRTQPMTAITPSVAVASPAAAAPSLPAPPSRPSPPAVVPTAAAAPVPPSPRDDRLTEPARQLARRTSMAAADLANALGCSERKARALLSELVAAGLARKYKEGRLQRWFATSSGARPDLDLPPVVLAVAARVDAAAIARIARDHARSPLLGVLGKTEELERAEPLHRLVYRVDFQEAVERPRFGGLFGTATDQRLGSVYLHPKTLALLVFHPQQGLDFATRPAEYASEVVDFDGAVDFVELPPGSLVLDEADYAQRRDPAEITRSLRQRYSVLPSRVAPVFVPLWRVLLRVDRGASYRVLLLDAITGHTVDWP